MYLMCLTYICGTLWFLGNQKWFPKTIECRKRVFKYISFFDFCVFDWIHNFTNNMKFLRKIMIRTTSDESSSYPTLTKSWSEARIALISSKGQGYIKKGKRILLLAWYDRWNWKISEPSVIFVKGSTRKHRKPMIKTDLPVQPWQMVSSDLFTCDETEYLGTVDHCSTISSIRWSGLSWIKGHEDHSREIEGQHD